MIQLKPDCLIIRTADGDRIPCSAEWLTLEILGEVATGLERELIEDVSAAVLHYFRFERAQESVSVSDFAKALGTVLNGLGLSVGAAPASTPVSSSRVVDLDLHQFAANAGEGCELFFFPSLRDELKRHLESGPELVRVSGLRPCVKQLAGTSRWNRRCQTLNDQIVEYLRTCWQSEAPGQSCALVVS